MKKTGRSISHLLAGKISRTSVLTVLFTLVLEMLYGQSPETYKWDNVAIGGGGFVSAIIPSKTQANLFYARTDVGGAYRWDAVENKWVPLLDWVSEEEVGYLGVESIALDPNASNRLYMLAGISYFNNGKTAILRSEDYGRTFTVTDVTNQFKAHGNGMGRQNGERLQVDPNNGNVLYCGTRWNGLFKSTNAGATWTRLTSLNVTTTPNENGVCIVSLDPSTAVNGTTQRLFVGVSRTGSNFYRSDNAGSTFTAVSGGPTTLMPQRMVISGGFVYITYGDGAGPHGHWAAPEPYELGQVWKYEIATGTWTNITPTGFTRPFSGISVDPANPQRLILSTINTWMHQYDNAWGDRILLSSNGGASWTDIIARGFSLDPNGVTWINGKAIHWTGCLEFDPFNNKKVLVTSGNGIFVNENIDATLGVWKFNVKGLEETVPLGLESIPGGPLVSVIGDYDGFRHTDPLQYAPIHTPNIGTTTGLACAALNPAKMVRVGTSMYYSTDMGVSWSQCSINGQKGKVAVSANGNIFLHCAEGSSTTYRSTNNGSSWSAINSLNIADANPVADPVNALKFYVYNPTNGSVMTSVDGGVTFSSGGTAGGSGSKIIRTVPGKEGDIWIPLYWGGLKRSTNSGQTFSTISGVTYCGAVGFGKAPTGSTFPTVYIWGTVNNIKGVYRSVDQGLTWTRVNDDAHEYGGPANGQFVQGDMNVFGRIYMSTAGRGIAFGEADASAGSLSVTPSSLSFSQSGGSQTINVTSNVSWTASSNVAWLTVSPASGVNNGTFQVICQANSGNLRNGVVTVSGAGITRTISVSQNGTGNTIVVRARGSQGTEAIELRSDNVMVASWTVTSAYADYTANATGAISVHFVNDARNTDVQIDYVTVNGVFYQAEHQSVNTGFWAKGKCGGKAFSEWLNCNGHIAFTTSSSGRSAASISIDGDPETSSITAFPNPVEDKITIHLSDLSPETRVSLIQSSGMTLKEERPVSLDHIIDMSSMPAGLYFIRVSDVKTWSTLKVFKK